MATLVLRRGDRRSHAGESVIRTIIYVLTAVAVAAGLLLFDDMDSGLPVVSLIVWSAVVLAGVLVALRSHRRRQRRTVRNRRSGPPRRASHPALHDRRRPLEITRR